jgi:hypothetical protein
MKRLAPAIWLLSPAAALAQGAVLQGGAITPGHVPQYVAAGQQAVVQDSGTAAGGSPGVNPSELGISARGNGTGPFPNSGTGPNYSHFCLYDGPTTGPNHYLCLDANALGGGLISYGAQNGAVQLGLNFVINGTSYSFPPSGGATSQLLSVSTVTLTGTVTVAYTQQVVVIDKATPAATSVVLPASSNWPNCPTVANSCPVILVKDGAGNAATYPITVTAADGKAVDGSSSFAMSSNWQATQFVLTGTQWSAF